MLVKIEENVQLLIKDLQKYKCVGVIHFHVEN